MCTNWLSFPPASAVEGIKSVPCVCVSVCQLVGALMAEPFDVRTQNLVSWLTLTMSRMSSKVKVIGQSSRSPCYKKLFSDVFYGVMYVDPVCHDTWRHGTTAGRHVTSWYDVMTSQHDVLTSFWRLLGKNTDKEGTSREGASTLRRFHFIYFL